MKLLSNLRKMYELELDNRCTALALSLFFAANLLTFHLPYTYAPTYFAKAQYSIWHKIYPGSDKCETISSKIHHTVTKMIP